MGVDWFDLSLDQALMLAGWGSCFAVMGVVIALTILGLFVRGQKACCRRGPTIAFFHPYR
jgi:hypothetical protein